MKGQVFSIDSLVAFSIFFLIIAMIAYLWIEVSLIPSFDIQQRSNEVADFMITDKMADDNVLNCSKLFELTLEDYEDLRSELNIGPYDFWIELEGLQPEMCPDVRPELDVMMVFDVSGSMDNEIQDLKDAGKTFVDEFNESYDQAGLIYYATSPIVEFELLNMTNANKTTLKGPTCGGEGCAPWDACDGEGGINGLCCNVFWSFSCWGPRKYCNNCDGWTNIGDAILDGITELDKGRGFPPVFKIQVLLSDGNPTRPFGDLPLDIEYTLNASYQACLDDNIIYTISLGDEANQTLMEQVAEKTYGKHYHAPASEDLEEIFLNISREISVTSDYGKKSPNNVRDISTITRILRAGNKTLKMNVRIFEFIEGETKVCE